VNGETTIRDENGNGSEIVLSVPAVASTIHLIYNIEEVTNRP
jgi:hypothetical protein